MEEYTVRLTKLQIATLIACVEGTFSYLEECGTELNSSDKHMKLTAESAVDELRCAIIEQTQNKRP